MPTFILAGVQRSLSLRVKKALASHAPQFCGWTALAQDGHINNQHDIGMRQVDELLAMASEHEAHIFGVSVSKRRGEVEALLRPYFRFRWLDARDVGPVGAGNEQPLVDAILNALEEEIYWREEVKPKDWSSPLILPELFSANRGLQDMWRLSQSFNNLGHLTAAASCITRFTSSHRRRVDGMSYTPWVAQDDWIWNDGGERHGSPEFPRDWKYSLRLPDGFHFDVSANVKGKSFFVDKYGKRHNFKKNINVTAHGEIRGDSGTYT